MVYHLHFVLAWMQQSSFVSGISFWSMQFWDTGYLHLLKLWRDIFDITCTSLSFAFQFFHITVICMHAQLCLTLWDPMDCSPPGSPVHGISQARILKGMAISFSRGIFPTQGLNPGLQHCSQILYRLSHQGSPQIRYTCFKVECCVIGAF